MITGTAHARPLARLPVPWWNPSWGYARIISVSTGPNAPLNRYSAYSVRLVIDTSDPSRFQPDCDDLRIVYWDGSSNIELDREIFNCGSPSTEVWYSLQADIPDSSVDSNYYVYYGNPAAVSPPNDRSSIYLWWDDFSTNPFAVGSPRYTRAKAVDIHGMGYLAPTYDVTNQRVNFDTGDNITSDIYIDNASFSNVEQDVLIQVDHWADFSYPSNATDTIGARVSALNTSSTHEYLHFSHGSYSGSPGCSIDSWTNAERNDLCGGVVPPVYWAFNTVETWTWAVFGTTHRFWRDAGVTYTSPDPSGRTMLLTGTLSSPQTGYMGLAPAQSRGWWDNLLVRRYTEPEPTLTLGVEEIFSPPQIIDPKVDSLFSDVDGNGVPSPGDILGYAVSISNGGGSHATSVTFADTPDGNTTLQVGSVSTTQGIVTSGNSPGDTVVTVDIGMIAPGDTVTITFQVAINDPLPSTIDRVANQGTVSGDNFPDTPTDDPATALPDDPTVTLLEILAPELPSTGFAIGRRTLLPEQRESEKYVLLGDLVLEIPKLDLRSQIVGVQLGEAGWDVTWLSDRVGHLEGTAFPTWSGNTFITGHLYLADGTRGPFQRLRELHWGDEIILHAFGQRYIYAVRESKYVAPDDISVLSHEERDWLTLLTCQGYNEAKDAYRWRLAVRAVLMQIEDE